MKLKVFNGKKVDFYKLLEDHAYKVYEAYEKLVDYFDEGNGDISEEIYFLEHDADDLRRILIDRLNQTLITPFDREDIFILSRTVDDIIDAAKSTVEEIKIFEIVPNNELLMMAKILKDGTLEIYDALRNLKQNLAAAMEHAKKAKETENQMDLVYLKALANLFNDEKNRISYIMKMRELYRHLRRSANSCDDAANTISDIIVKI